VRLGKPAGLHAQRPAGSTVRMGWPPTDGRHMAVGALEARFFAELLRLLTIDPDDSHPADQHNRDRWPWLRAKLSEVFATRTQAEWTEVFAATDACVAPVASLREAAAHPQDQDARQHRRLGCILQAGAAPRFSGHPAAKPGHCLCPVSTPARYSARASASPSQA